MNTIYSEREIAMKDFSDKFRKGENEQVKMDHDDFIEDELKTFRRSLKGIKSVRDIINFDNWFKLYKVLNYDIIDNLKLNKVDKVNAYCARVEIIFKGKIEYDIIKFNKDSLCCEVFRFSKGEVENRVIRRVLIPSNSNEALIYFERHISKHEKDAIEKIVKLGVNENKANTIESKKVINDRLEKKIDNNSQSKEFNIEYKNDLLDIKNRILNSLTRYERKIWENHVINADYLNIQRRLEKKLINELKLLSDNKMRIELISIVKFANISNTSLRMKEATSYLRKIL